jgi:hypothetical protein
MRRTPDTGGAAGANDALLLAKPRNVPACPVVLPLKASAAKNAVKSRQTYPGF